jgi:hypothetical protein
LFGTGADHLTAAATEQIDFNLIPNTWTTLSYDQRIIDSNIVDGMDILTVFDGIINIPRGEWDVDASVLAHRTGSGGASGVVLSIQGYFTDTQGEIPFSFNQGVAPVFGNDPISLRTSFLIDNVNHTTNRMISIRVQSDTNRCRLGANPGTVPDGSQNHAGYLKITRIG